MSAPRRSSATAVILAHLAATAFMTGVIWYVQVVHYPLMTGWPHGQFGAWEARHRERTGRVVVPAMLLEAVTAGVLAVRPPQGVSGRLIILNLALLACIWASTFLLQVPCHDLLSLGWDERVHAHLVQTNWLRTVLWSGRLALAATMMFLVAGIDDDLRHDRSQRAC